MRIKLRGRVSDDQHLELAATLRKVRTRFERGFGRIRSFVDNNHHTLGVDALNVGHSLGSVALGDGDSGNGVSVVAFDGLKTHLRIDHVSGESA